MRLNTYLLKRIIKSLFQNDMAYGYLKVIKRRTVADKLLRDKTFNIAKDPKYDGYERGLASIVHNVLNKTIIVVQIKMKLFLIKN